MVISMRDKISPWIAAIFCAALSAITIIGNLWLMVVNKTSQNGVESTFYCFLPMCFYFVGGEIMKLKNENRELRKIVEELANKPTGAIAKPG